MISGGKVESQGLRDDTQGMRAADGRGRERRPGLPQLTAAALPAAPRSGSAQKAPALKPCEPRPKAWLKRAR